MKKTIGGDRLGAGKKMQTDLNNYGRSTHNLSEDNMTTLSVGTLVPIYRKIALNGDVWDIDINAMVRTLPTQAPLFGTFKLQIDIFQIPIRLYQGILHNNPVSIGLKMNEVKLPKILMSNNESSFTALGDAKINYDNSQTAPNSLTRYCGIAGIGKHGTVMSAKTATRKYFAGYHLAYYDIFKTYYSNKQEEQAYVIRGAGTITQKLVSVQMGVPIFGYEPINIELNSGKTSTQQIPYYQDHSIIRIETDGRAKLDLILIGMRGEQSSADTTISALKAQYPEYINTEIVGNNTVIFIDINAIKEYYESQEDEDFVQFAIINEYEILDPTNTKLQPFDLSNIDDMRKDLLSLNELGDEYVISDENAYLPYSVNVEINDGKTGSVYEQAGLCVKTYLSDVYNNWLNTEWIDGEDGISALTAIDTSSGSFTMDALNLQEKMYNMLNRIAISGGTYDDWQEAVFGEKAIRKAESPMYCGGMSAEVVFEEVVSTAETDVAGGENTKLGSLGGKGTLTGHKGGKVTIVVKEPSMIMAIASLTPRICYTQGNEWDTTELDSLNDIHKPALDGIGFQNLITEQMAWWDNVVTGTEQAPIINRKSAGKVPAWINYMTTVNHAYGDFADINKAGYMVLARHYDMNNSNGSIKDLTTYIDPRKYNYPFAYAELNAQNFWLQTSFKAIARRKISAKIIPNL